MLNLPNIRTTLTTRLIDRELNGEKTLTKSLRAQLIPKFLTQVARQFFNRHVIDGQEYNFVAGKHISLAAKKKLNFIGSIVIRFTYFQMRRILRHENLFIPLLTKRQEDSLKKRKGYNLTPVLAFSTPDTRSACNYARAIPLFCHREKRSCEPPKILGSHCGCELTKIDYPF